MTEIDRSITLTIDDLEDITLDQFQVFTDIKPDVYAGLKEEVKTGRIITPVVITSLGAVVDGHQRLRAYFELKEEGETPPPFKVDVVPGDLTDVEIRSMARRLNLLRRQVGRKDVQRYIVEQLMETPEWSNKRIARHIGCSHETVAKVRKSLEDSGRIPYYEKLESADGYWRPRETRDKAIKKLEAKVVEDALEAKQSRRGHNLINPLPSRSELASNSQQSKKEREKRLDNRSFRKACHALQLLNEAAEVNPERAAGEAGTHQAEILTQVHESTHRWLYAFMEALQDRRGVDENA